MPDQRNTAIEFAHNQRDRFLDELSELIAIPSISADSAYRKDIQRAAECSLPKDHH